MSDLLLYGDTERSAALRHEIPIAITDPFLYAEVDGQVYLMVSPLERDRVSQARPDATLIDVAEVGFYELLRGELKRDEIYLELTSRAAARTGVREAIVDFDFPLGLAERLRADGIRLTVEDEQVKLRRRAKSGHELDRIRRAQRAAEAGMAAAAALLRSAEDANGTLRADGRPLTAEAVRAVLRQACDQDGAPAPADVIVASVWQGFGHESGTGPLPARLPIQIDLWPRDEKSGCWADMTRTFLCGGQPSDEVARQLEVVRNALESVRAAARPGVLGRDLYEICADRLEAEGYRTQRSGAGEDTTEGMQFSLGHGVGLEVHEDPPLGLTGRSPLIAGDVIAIEPGLWDREVGGVRFEDLLLITDSGCETLTDFPYDLTP